MNREVPRLIEFHGSDADYVYFSTKSWSNPDVEYDIRVDARTGMVTCSCMGCVCHHKVHHLLNLLGQPQDVCKHVRAMLKTWGYLFKVGV